LFEARLIEVVVASSASSHSESFSSAVSLPHVSAGEVFDVNSAIPDRVG